jgi:hypothetical protein
MLEIGAAGGGVPVVVMVGSAVGDGLGAAVGVDVAERMVGVRAMVGARVTGKEAASVGVMGATGGVGAA